MEKPSFVDMRNKKYVPLSESKPNEEKCLEWISSNKSFVDIKRELMTAGKTEDEYQQWMSLMSSIIAKSKSQKHKRKTSLIALLVGSFLIIGGIITIISSNDLFSEVAKRKVFFRGSLLSVLGFFIALAGGIKYFKKID